MNYLFKSIIRNFKRKPATNLINLLGLCVSLSLVIILSVYCYSELTTDNHQINGKRVFIYGLSKNFIKYTPGILKDYIDQNVPEIQSAVRIGGSWEDPVFQAENREPVTTDLIYADDDFFKLFTYQALEGNLASALKEPMSVVITKELSEKVFGEKSALGQQLKINNSQIVTVSAVIMKPVANSCLSFSAVTSMATRKIIQPNQEEFTHWNEQNFQTFVMLKNGSDAGIVAKKILSLFPEDERDAYKDQSLMPLRKIYFSKFTLFGDNYLVCGDKKKVLILVLVALLVLLIALINYINISASQWEEKTRQTGIKKVFGAMRPTIIREIITESSLFFIGSLLIGFYLVISISPAIRNLTGIQFNSQIILSPGFLISTLTLVLLLSLLLSVIPALRISNSRAVDNLKKTSVRNKISSSQRGTLVVIQFFIAIVLIVFTILVQKQVRYGSSNLGFNQSNIIAIKLTEQLNQKKDVLKDLLQKDPVVEQVSFSQYFPGKTMSEWGSELNLKGKKKDLHFDTFCADADFFKILGLELVSGRFYTSDLTTDKRKIIVNEAFIHENNIVDPLGGKIGRGDREYEIVGVVKDFHYKPVNQPIISLAIRSDSYASYCLVKVGTENFNALDTTIEKIKKTVSDLSPSFPVEVSFLEHAIQNMYKSEVNFRRAFSLLALCAIVICCMGILAMSLFACQHRVKEIGIRKANGARIFEILSMLNKEFVKWVLIAFVISIPVALYLIHQWLKEFAYKTAVSWWIFALGGLIALAIALLTVSWHSFHAAKKNPVEALRYE